VLSGRVIRPLRQLGRDASLLAFGELSHRSAVRSRDEPGDAAQIAPRLKERGPASVLALNAPACCLAPRTGKLHPFVQYRPSLECRRVKKLT
jgi:hypothetical protein